MKVCSNCGYENEDQAKFCVSCGNTIQTLIDSDSQIDFNPDNNTNQRPVKDSVNDSQVNQEQFNNQQQYNNQQSTYQQTYQNRPHKMVWLAVLLNIIGGIFFYFLSGIGQIYLGLVKRGIALCGCGVAVSIINAILIFAFGDAIGGIVSLILGFALMVYSAYDAYLCGNAINEGNPIPLLFGSLDLE